jgi:Na+/H+ antiporter NhaA
MANGSKNVLQRGLENIHDPFSSFIRAQTTSSLFLLAATIAALWWANSAYSSTYQNLVHTPIGFFVGEFELRASLKHIINDGLMVIFFFLLGLEIKREVLAGNLARPENRRMLIVCAVGGMVCPAVIYSLFNWSLDSQIGWAIPMATDTAFALGVLALVRKHIPVSLQHPIGLGIITGLVIGKFIGISGACWLGLRYKIGSLPDDVHLKHVIGVSLIAGIGFTMSTFIAALGFDAQPEHLHNAKTSILVASVLSAILGVLYIRIISTKNSTR